MLETIPEVGTRWLPRCSYSKNNRNFSSHPLASPIGSNFKKCGKKNLNLRHRSLNLKAVSRHICFQCPAELGSLPCPWLKSHLIRAEAWAGFMASTCRGSPRAGEQQISHSMEQAGKAWTGRQVNPSHHLSTHRHFHSLCREKSSCEMLPALRTKLCINSCCILGVVN